MKSIERRFDKIQKKNPYYSSIICFNLAVMEQGFSEVRIARQFNKLVDKDDYFSSDKKDILLFLYTFTKPLNRVKNEGL